MVPDSMLLVHSPLVGPTSLTPLGAAAERHGIDVALPDLASIADSDEPHALFTRLAVDAGRTLPTAPTIVGHSGAGAFLPAIASAIGDVAGTVFLDAVLPPVTGAHETSPAMASLLDRVADGDRLRPWLDWWPAETIDRLLPDERDRSVMAADIPRLRRSFYDVPVEVPDRWSERRCAYLALGDAYAEEYREANDRGWPTARLDADHLAPFTRPDAVLRAVIDVAARLA